MIDDALNTLFAGPTLWRVLALASVHLHLWALRKLMGGQEARLSRLEAGHRSDEHHEQLLQERKHA